MPDTRTTITELATGLGMLGHDDVAEALGARPPEMVSVSPALWEDLTRWSGSPLWRQAFEAAFSNGSAFLAANHALRGRRPLVVEWRGSSRPVDDDLVPADLRVDHVYLISCKYLSRILGNVAPGRLFDGLLRLRTPSERQGWYDVVAPDELAELVAAACRYAEVEPRRRFSDLDEVDRNRVRAAVQGRSWPVECVPAWQQLCATVSERTASRWQAAIASDDDRRRLFWRLTRIGPTPYFVLGVGERTMLRLRVLTSWDWSERHRLEHFDVRPGTGGQPLVAWRAAIRDRDLGELREVEGHVEIRWSHGRLKGAPEAKVYLDTPHAAVPGYVPLD